MSYHLVEFNIGTIWCPEKWIIIDNSSEEFRFPVLVDIMFGNYYNLSSHYVIFFNKSFSKMRKVDKQNLLNMISDLIPEFPRVLKQRVTFRETKKGYIYYNSDGKRCSYYEWLISPEVELFALSFRKKANNPYNVILKKN